MRPRSMPSLLILGIILVAQAAACDNSDTDGGQTDPSRTPSATDSDLNATVSPVLVNLQRQYEEIRFAQKTISDIWEGLATGEQAQCGQYPDMTGPDAIIDDETGTFVELVDWLRRAAIETEKAVNLWKAECNNPRTVLPPDVIDQGRLASRAAGDALREAERLLAEIQ
jgi:hypothetical protein